VTIRQAARRSGSTRGLHREHPGIIVGVVLVCQLMVTLDATIVTIALPQIGDSIGFSTADLSWVLNAYTLTFGGLLLLGARAGDILGRRTTLTYGVGLFTIASLIGGFAQNPGELLLARAAQGVGSALASPAALALLMTTMREGRQRTRAIAWYAAVSVGGSAIGLIAGGLLVQWVSWRWVFLVNVPIGIAEVIAAWMVIGETPRVRGAFDLTGGLTSTVGVAALVYGFVRAATAGWSDPQTIIAFVIGAVLLVAFVLTEQRAESPITPLRLFADRDRTISYVARLFLVAGMFGMFFFLSQFLQDVLGYSPLATGVAFLPLTVAVFVASQLTARMLVERFGSKMLMVGGIALSTTGLFWLSHLSAGSGYISVVGPLLCFGIGNGVAFVPLTTIALAGVPAEDAGAASGLVNVMQQVGGSLGLAILVTIFGTVSRHALDHAPVGLSATEAAHHAFVAGATRVFQVSTGFLIVTLLLLTFAIKGTPPLKPEQDEKLLEELATTDPIGANAST
jgi:EmrB/QacA subfamily drug resistance transporter